MLPRMARLQKPELSLAQRVRKLRGKQTQEDLAFAVREKTGRKITPGTISQIENERIRPEADTMAAVLTTLGQKPAQVPEYRLARARELLDERASGLPEALRYLVALERGLRDDGMDLARAIRADRRPRPQTPAPPEDAQDDDETAMSGEAG